MVMNSSLVAYPSRIPFGAVVFGMALNLIIELDVGDDERGDVGAVDVESSESEGVLDLVGLDNDTDV